MMLSRSVDDHELHRAATLVGFAIEVGDIVVLTDAVVEDDELCRRHHVAAGSLAVVSDLCLYPAPRNVSVGLWIPVRAWADGTNRFAESLIEGLWDESATGGTRFPFRPVVDAERKGLHPGWMPRLAGNISDAIAADGLGRHARRARTILIPALEALSTRCMAVPEHDDEDALQEAVRERRRYSTPRRCKPARASSISASHCFQEGSRSASAVGSSPTR